MSSFQTLLSIKPALAAAEAPAAPKPPTSGARQAPSFAAMLRENRRAPVQPEPAAPQADAAPVENRDTGDVEPAARLHAATKARPRPTEKADMSGAAKAVEQAAESDVGNGPRLADRIEAAVPSATDPALPPLPLRPPEPILAKPATDATLGSDGGDDGDGAITSVAARGALVVDDPSNDASDADARPRTEADKPGPTPADSLLATGPVPLAAPPLPLQSVAPPRPTLDIQAPVASTEFPQALGVQVSLLVQGGIQQAELHLNPAEMGPVSVQIVIDGTQARIDFGADLAATREAIEAGLPELAGALRDAGFTLAGGGVSQHARGRSDGSSDAGADNGTANPGGGRAAAGRADGDDANGRNPSRSMRRSINAGGIDLYA